MTLRIELLGPPRVLRDGRTVAFETRKALALVAYVATTRRVHSRDAVAGVLWADADTTHARGALRRTLSSLRKSADDALIVDRNTLALHPDVEVDVSEVRALSSDVRGHRHDDDGSCDRCLELSERAASLMRGTFMEGFALNDAPVFEEWRRLEQDVLHNELVWVLRAAAEGRATRGDAEAALHHVIRWIALDPLQEPAHVMAMRLHASLGDRPGAIRQYRECVRILSEELGVPPLPATVAAYREIAAGAPAPPPDAGKTPHAVDLPMVGRAADLARARRVVGRMPARGGLVLVEGEAGIGKTRFARELLDLARGDGLRTLEIRCHEEERAHPFGVVTRLISSIVEDAPASALTRVGERAFVELTRLVPDLRSLRAELPQPVPLTDPGARTLFLEGILESLHAVTATTGWVVLLDDLHWADPGSLELLSLIGRRISQTPLGLVATWRSEESGAGQAIRRLDAGRADDSVHLRLGRLSREDVQMLLEVVRPERAADLGDRIFAETEGVPFFVNEYVSAAAASGEASTARERALDLVRGRIAAVSGAPQQILAAAAVVGRSFPLGLLQSVAGRSEEETVEAIEDLTERGLVRPLDAVGAPTYDFTHEMVRAAVYESTSLARRRLLHRRAAEALAARGSRRAEDVALAAHHFTRSGDEAQAALLHVRAAELARSLFANSEALVHLETALALGAPDTAGLQEQVGDLQTLLGRYARAADAYETASALAPERLPRIARKLAALAMRRGDALTARMHLSEALEVDDGERGRALADLSLAWADDDPDQARRLAEDAAHTAERSGDAEGEAQALNLLGLLERRAGELEAAVRHLRQSLDAARRLPHPAPRVAALNNLALAERDAGRLPEAVALTKEALELCARVGDVHREAALANNLADLLHASGEARASQTYAKRAAGLFAQVGERPSSEPGIWRLVAW